MAKNANPTRMCCGCMKRFNKDELLRICKNADGVAFADESKKYNSRGAYVCYDTQCINKAEKKRWFSRNLKCEIPPDLYDKLKMLAGRK